MQKGLFAKELMKEYGLTKKTAMAIVDKFVDSIRDELVAEGSCHVPCIGTLKERVQEERYFTPPIGEKVLAPRCMKVSFKPSKYLLKAVNDKAQ